MTSLISDDPFSSAQDHAQSPLEGQGRQVLDALRPFARANDGLSSWQVTSTLVLTLALLEGIAVVHPYPLKWLLFLPLAALLVRLFVLQHDCGHLSLFSDKRVCNGVGTGLSILTGVAYEAWRTEHSWHHGHQARLDDRGIDLMNSPITKDEALQNPDRARGRAKKISVLGVFMLGAVGLAVMRKRHKAYFQFRPGFRWPVHNHRALIASVRFTNWAQAGLHLALLAWLGPLVWLGLIVPAYFCASGLGALLFWVQHNFEGTYHAREAEWTFVDAGLKGASYLKLPTILDWATASIGLHHVHHLNVLIPNYRLEAARTAVPEVAAVAPLTLADLKKCFTHIFWDEDERRMLALDSLFTAGVNTGQ